MFGYPGTSGPPGLARKKLTLHFSRELDDEPSSSWAGEIDQVVFRGSFAMAELAFFHRESRTAIMGDLIQRFPEGSLKGWTGLVMRLGGLQGEQGGTPRDWRASFLWHGPSRAALQKAAINCQRRGRNQPRGAGETLQQDILAGGNQQTCAAGLGPHARVDGAWFSAIVVSGVKETCANPKLTIKQMQLFYPTVLVRRIFNAGAKSYE